MNMHIKVATDDKDRALLAAIQDGLPLCERPFAEIGKVTNMSEEQVIARIEHMRQQGIISRFGLVLQHRPLGYRANAMVVWNVPDQEVDEAAKIITAHDFVTLCYCRARRAPVWQFNLYCMIHGQQRSIVEQQIETIKSAGLAPYPSKTLFSLRRFKQTGARFSTTPENERRLG